MVSSDASEGRALLSAQGIRLPIRTKSYSCNLPTQSGTFFAEEGGGLDISGGLVSRLACEDARG